MLTKEDKEILYKKLVKYENKISHMYADTQGKVTVGIGHMIPNASHAMTLPFYKDEKGTQKATAEEIKKDYETVKAKFVVNTRASVYKRFTKLVMKSEDIDALAYKHIDQFYRELKQLFKTFDDLPKAAQLALFDMIFNLGMTKFSRSNWPKLYKAIESGDWDEAAKQSKRNKIPDSRNKYVAKLFLKAKGQSKSMGVELKTIITDYILLPLNVG